jgi:hypothetical protein
MENKCYRHSTKVQSTSLNTCLVKANDSGDVKNVSMLINLIKGERYYPSRKAKNRLKIFHEILDSEKNKNNLLKKEFISLLVNYVSHLSWQDCLEILEKIFCHVKDDEGKRIKVCETVDTGEQVFELFLPRASLDIVKFFIKNGLKFGQFKQFERLYTLDIAVVSTLLAWKTYCGELKFENLDKWIEFLERSDILFLVLDPDSNGQCDAQEMEKLISLYLIIHQLGYSNLILRQENSTKSIREMSGYIASLKQEVEKYLLPQIFDTIIFPQLFSL